MQQKLTLIEKVTTGRVMDMAELSNVQGRPWDDIDVSSKVSACYHQLPRPNDMAALSAAFFPRQYGKHEGPKPRIAE